MASKDQAPSGPFHAGPGTGHEIGIMIGFMAAFALTMIIYYIFFRMHNTRALALDRQRREQLTARGIGGLDEKNTALGNPMYADEDDISPAVSTSNNGPKLDTNEAAPGPTLGIPREVKTEKEIQQEKDKQDGIGSKGWSLGSGLLKGKKEHDSEGT